jgi:starch synthase
MKKLNIMIAASEVVPYAKSGGLADVVGVLPKALRALGHNVIVVMPRYYIIDKELNNLTPLVGALGVPMGVIGEEWAEVFEGRLPGSDVPIYFIENHHYFGRVGLYNENSIDFTDNDSRFVFLSKAAMQLCKKLEFEPDIIHANDWHTAPMTILRNTLYAHDPLFAHSATVLTIHNLQHQGRFSKGAMDILGIGWWHFNEHELEEYDGVNFLKGGIVHSNGFNAVSQKYAQEIKTGEFGWGLDWLVRQHEGKLHGILNGVDYDEWSPAIDTMIPATFDAHDLSGKAICKRELQKHFGLPQNENIPVIGFVGRFAEQKGITLIAEAIWDILKLDIQIVMLGTGEQWAADFFGDIATRFPDKFALFVGYRNDIAHQIEAGADLFLMPSLFEPCGLNQIYSLRYGTLPIVRATGGLDDTIENYEPYSDRGDGFKFYEPTAHALFHTIKWAVDTYYHDKEGMNHLIQNAMAKRFDWEVAARGYEAMYFDALEARFRHH